MASAELDARQIGFECSSVVALSVAAAESRAGEQHGRRMEAGVAVGPNGLVRQTVESGVGVRTSLDLDA